MNTASIEDLAKLELRVGTVIKAERIEGTDKMLRLMVDIGYKTEDGQLKLQQILTGIATSYMPEELVGKQIVVIANLEPRMMFKGIEQINNGQGLESQGMLLAAEGSNGSVLLTIDKEVKSGSNIK